MADCPSWLNVRLPSADLQADVVARGAASSSSEAWSPTGRLPSTDLQAAVCVLASEHGLHSASDRLGISRSAVVAIANGLPVGPSIVAAAHDGLKRIAAHLYVLRDALSEGAGIPDYLYTALVAMGPGRIGAWRTILPTGGEQSVR
jgi:hypothetical protein